MRTPVKGYRWMRPLERFRATDRFQYGDGCLRELNPNFREVVGHSITRAGFIPNPWESHMYAGSLAGFVRKIRRRRATKAKR